MPQANRRPPWAHRYQSTVQPVSPLPLQRPIVGASTIDSGLESGHDPGGQVLPSRRRSIFMANPRVHVPDLNLWASSPQPWYFRRVTIALVIGALFIAMLVAFKDSELAQGDQPKPSAEQPAMPGPSLPPGSKTAQGSPIEKIPAVTRAVNPALPATTATFNQITQMDEDSLIRAAQATNIRELVESDPGLVLRMQDGLPLDAPKAKVLLLMAEAEFQLGYYRRAAETYTKLIHHQPGIAKYRYFRAMAFAAGKRTDRALFDLEDAISREPRLATEAREEPRFVPLSRNSKFRDLTRAHP